LGLALVPHAACNAIFGIDSLRYDAAGGAAGHPAGGHGGMGAGGGAGQGGEAGAGGTVASTPDCSGDWGVPQPLLTEAELPSSPSIARAELELTYVRRAAGTEVFVRSVRASTDENFPTAEVASDLANVCDPGELPSGVDLSEDGLRAYVSCEIENPSTARVVLLTRPSSGLAFELQGQVASAGRSPAVDRSELALYTGGLPYPGPPFVSKRTTTAGAFEPATVVPGLEGVELHTPAPTPDDLGLFGYVLAPDAGTLSLAVASRESPDAAFEAPVLVGTGLDLSGAPDLTADCRAVYFVGAAGSTFAIYVMRR
jgi:hypothetical protein